MYSAAAVGGGVVPTDHRGGEAPHSPGLTTGGQSWGEETDTPPQGFLPPLSGSVLGRPWSRRGPAIHGQGDHSSDPAERRQDGGKQLSW